MPAYHKLIRDRIPEILQKEGLSFRVEKLSGAGYKRALQKKLQEELEEYFSCRNDTEAIEELADLLEVIRALSGVHESDPEKLEAIRKRKAEQRGAFQKKLFLIDVDD